MPTASEAAARRDAKPLTLEQFDDMGISELGAYWPELRATVEALAAAEARVKEMEAHACQENHLHPDWSMLEATRDSLREHFSTIKTLHARIAELEALHAANDEMIGSLQESLSRETAAHLATTRERDEARDAQMFNANTAIRLREALTRMVDVGELFYDMDMGKNGSEAIDVARAALAATPEGT